MLTKNPIFWQMATWETVSETVKEFIQIGSNSQTLYTVWAPGDDMVTQCRNEDRPLLLPKDTDPVKHLHGLIASLRLPDSLIDVNLQVIEKNWRWKAHSLQSRITNICSPIDPLSAFRIPLVAESLLKFCDTHSALLKKEPGLWRQIYRDILCPLSYRTRGKYANEMNQVGQQFIELTPKIAGPTDQKIFRPSEKLTTCIQWIAKAYFHPEQYELSFLATDGKQLFLQDRATQKTCQMALPFALDIIYENGQLANCILISNCSCEKGSSLLIPICWDVLSGQSLVLKNQTIYEDACPIIEQIAEQKWPEVVPMFILSTPSWRVYETDCKIDLLHVLANCQLDTDQKLECAHQLLQMLADLHKRTYLIDGVEVPAFHGDIKPSNILHHNERLVLTDFGSTSLSLPPGTRGYLSPEGSSFLEARKEGTENWEEFNQYRQAQDVWAMGTLLLKLLHSYYGKKTREIAKPSNLPQELEPIWACVEKMLRQSPKERISAQQALALLETARKKL